MNPPPVKAEDLLRQLLVSNGVTVPRNATLLDCLKLTQMLINSLRTGDYTPRVRDPDEWEGTPEYRLYDWIPEPWKNSA
jgi:hypothetical protein